MKRATCILALFIGLPGCSAQAAPSYALFGAFFPVWLLCGIIGVIAAILARVGLVATGLADIVPAQLLVCVSAGVIAAGLIWLIWWGQ